MREELFDDVIAEVKARFLKIPAPNPDPEDIYKFYKDSFDLWHANALFEKNLSSRPDLEEIYSELLDKTIRNFDFRRLWPELKHHEMIEMVTLKLFNCIITYYFTHPDDILYEEVTEYYARGVTGCITAMAEIP